MHARLLNAEKNLSNQTTAAELSCPERKNTLAAIHFRLLFLFISQWASIRIPDAKQSAFKLQQK